MAVQTVAIGTILGPFGIKGKMKVHILTDFPERFTEMRRMLLASAEPGNTPREVELESARFHKGLVLLKLTGVSTPEDVRPLIGRDLCIPEDQIKTLPAETYYVWQIEGLEVFTEEGDRLGQVADVWQQGGADIYVVRENGEKKGPAWMIPAVKQYVKKIDVAAGRMTVYVEEGLRG